MMCKSPRWKELLPRLKALLHLCTTSRSLKLTARCSTIKFLILLTCFHASFFPFCLFCSSSPFLGTFSPFFRPRKVLCSVEQRAQCRAWRGAVPGWISPQSSGRKFLPEICVKKGQITSKQLFSGAPDSSFRAFPLTEIGSMKTQGRTCSQKAGGASLGVQGLPRHNHNQNLGGPGLLLSGLFFAPTSESKNIRKSENKKMEPQK